MNDPYYFVAENGRPYDDWGAAIARQETLTLELSPRRFEVVPHPDGGFAVVSMERRQSVLTTSNAVPVAGFPEAPLDALEREMHVSDSVAEPPPIGGLLPPMLPPDTRKPTTAKRVQPDSEDSAAAPASSRDFTPRFTLRVAPRAFIRLHLLAAVGVVLILYPQLLFAPLGNFSNFQNAALGASLLGLVRLGGALLAVVAILKFLYAYLLYRFVVTEDYVQANLGWIARDAPKVFYAHIRTTSVVQSWWERLLMVGAVKIGTGATDEHEVVLQHIANPQRIEAELERRYLPFIRSQRRLVRAT